MKKTEGFVQIPILIAIIVGLAAVGGVGYFGVSQYQNKQQANILESQKETEANSKIEALKNRTEQNQQLIREFEIDKKPISFPVMATPKPVITISSPKIYSVTPVVHRNTMEGFLAVQGSGFQQGARVTLNDKYSLLINKITQNSIDALIPIGIEPRVYDIKIFNPDGGSTILYSSFTIEEPEKIISSPTPQQITVPQISPISPNQQTILSNQIDALLSEYKQKVLEIDKQILAIKQKYYEDVENLSNQMMTTTIYNGKVNALTNEANKEISKLELQKEALRLEYLEKIRIFEAEY